MNKLLQSSLLVILILITPNTIFAVGNGTIGLLPSVTGQPGSIIETPVMINTGGEATAGVDVVLNFNKDILELTDITVYPENSNNAFEQFLTADFNAIPQSPSEIQLISQANNQGTVSLSAITNVFTSFNGVLGPNNPLARIKFKVLTNSPTSVDFLFTPDSTTDTNMVSNDDRDLLKSVTNMLVNQNPPITYPEASSGAKPGDLDNNSTVDIYDYTQLLSDFSKTGSGLTSDIDKDDDVDIFDYTILLTNFGR